MDRSIFEIVLPFFERIPTVRAILSFIFIFFAPGFAWTLVFFRKITVTERIMLAFGLSIAMVTLSILAGNVLLKISITGVNAVLIIIVITAIPIAVYYLTKLFKGHSPE